jgi:transposase
MKIIGCDFHPSFQHVCYVDTSTGETGEQRLSHPDQARQFYLGLRGQKVRVGVESMGNLGWFQRLLSETGHELLIGDAARIRAACVRRQKTDRRDAALILRLMVEDRFPSIWQPEATEAELSQLLSHRCRMVRLAVRLGNQLDALAKNEGLVNVSSTSRAGRKRVEDLPLSSWRAVQRNDLYALYDTVHKRVLELDRFAREAAEAHQQACLLMTHPGVGAITSLAFVSVIGDWHRFPRGKQVASYLGLIPTESSSGQKRRLGSISKQGNSMMRWLLVEAATIAQRQDESWHRQYLRLSVAKHHGVAKVAMAHKLAVRLYWMLRSGKPYEEIVERNRHAGQSECPRGQK